MGKNNTTLSEYKWLWRSFPLLHAIGPGDSSNIIFKLLDLFSNIPPSQSIQFKVGLPFCGFNAQDFSCYFFFHLPLSTSWLSNHSLNSEVFWVTKESKNRASVTFQICLFLNYFPISDSLFFRLQYDFHSRQMHSP